MSFIDKSEKNVGRQLLKEVTGGDVAGFVGSRGMGIDRLYAGPYHPDSGHGSQNEKLLKQQIEYRKNLRKMFDIDDIEDVWGGELPIGGFFEPNDESLPDIIQAYEELFAIIDAKIKFNQEVTPLADTEWKSTGWEYDFDTPSEVKVRDIIYDDDPEYAGDNFVNKSISNWQVVNKEIK